MQDGYKRLHLVVLTMITSAVLLTSLMGLPEVNALQKRDYSYLQDSHCTVLYPCPGLPQVCGDHICVSGEYGKHVEKLEKAQMSSSVVNQSKSSSQTISASPQVTNTNKVETVNVGILNVTTYDLGVNHVVSLVTVAYNGTLLVNHLVLIQTNDTVKIITAWLSPDWIVNVSGNTITLDSKTASITGQEKIGVVASLPKATFKLTEAIAHYGE